MTYFSLLSLNSVSGVSLLLHRSLAKSKDLSNHFNKLSLFSSYFKLN